MNYPFYSNDSRYSTSMPGRPPYMEDMRQNQAYYGIKGRPVASIEEARASMIDFDGSVFYFPDMANQKIYTKQINLDGTSSLKVYSLVQQPQQMQQPQMQQMQMNSELPLATVTKQEFDYAIKTLNDEIQRLKGAMTKNDEPTVATDANVDATNYDFK